MIISQANSMRFRVVDSNLPNFDNTLLADEKFYNDKIFTYCQRWASGETESVVIKSNSDTVPTVIATKADKTTETLSAILIGSYDQDDDGNDDLFFFAFDVVMALFTTETFITVTQDAVTNKGEPFIADITQEELDNGEIYRVEYGNQENAFQIDFSSNITFTLYVPAIIKDYEFGGESSIYDNQDELEKLKETVQRILLFKTLEIPRYLAETLKLASSMDYFVINDVAFVRTEQPEIAPIEGSNLVDFSMALTDKEYLGVNSHDIGFDCDTPVTGEEIMVLVEENASGSVTFSVTGGYLIHTLKATYVSGTTVEIKLGTGVGTDDLVEPYDLTASITKVTAQIHADESESDYDVYATVTGGVADLTLQLIKNKE